MRGGSGDGAGGDGCSSGGGRRIRGGVGGGLRWEVVGGRGRRGLRDVARRCGRVVGRRDDLADPVAAIVVDGAVAQGPVADGRERGVGAAGAVAADVREQVGERVGLGFAERAELPPAQPLTAVEDEGEWIDDVVVGDPWGDGGQQPCAVGAAVDQRQGRGRHAVLGLRGPVVAGGDADARVVDREEADVAGRREGPREQRELLDAAVAR